MKPHGGPDEEMTTLKTLTVAQLIDLLQDQDPGARVIFSANYGDYSRTMQALPLKGSVDEVTIEKSAYSNSDFAVVEYEDEDCKDPNDRHGSFLVIR